MEDYYADGKGKKTKIIIIIIVLVIASILVVGIKIYFDKISKEKKAAIVGDTNAEITTAEDEGRDLQNEIRALNATYDDAIAWIKVPGTVIDAPVFKAANNEKYFRNDRDGKDNKYGEFFMDYRCNINNMDNMSHFIIYGHNTDKNDFFTPILNYCKEDFYKNHKNVEMSTINGNYKWEIFTAYSTTTDFFYIDTNFSSVTEYGTFLNTLKSKSLYNTGVEISSSDTILTLSTCDNSKKDGRFVVQAKLVKQ